MSLTSSLAVILLAPASQFLAVDNEVVASWNGSSWQAVRGGSRDISRRSATTFHSSTPFQRSRSSASQGIEKRGNRFLLKGPLASAKGIRVSGRAPTTPSRISGQQPGDDAILDQILTLLELKEIRGSAYVTQVYNLDLDGRPGTEKIVNAGNLGYPGSRPPIYSAVLAFQSDLSLTTVPIELIFVSRDRETPLCRAEAIADLDGDGKTEIVVTARRGNGGVVSLWQWENDGMTKVFESEFGN